MTKIPFYAEVIVNIEFKESSPKANKVEDIIVDGKNIGNMKITDRNGKVRYFASINLSGFTDEPFHLSSNKLIMGHGDTREEAITAAISTGYKDAMKLHQAIIVLEISLNK